MRSISIFLALFWSLFSTIIATSLNDDTVEINYGNWENTKYTRSIDLQKGYVKETASIRITNTGDLPNDEYYFTTNDGIGQITKLSAFVATTGNKASSAINVQLFEIEGVDAQVYKLVFDAPIAPGSTIDFKARYMYISGYEPLPAKIEMHETQNLMVRLNRYVYSPYVTKEYYLGFSGVTSGQELEFRYSGEVTNADELPPAEEFVGRVESSTLVYGPFTKEIPQFAISPFALQYEHNIPLKHVYNLDRSIWIPASNADKVSIEEYYEFTNRGAALASGFLRVDWQKGRYESNRNHWAISQLEFKLPNEAPEGIYYTDKVGVVSTHQTHQDHLIIQPRFPIFGGWNYNFTIGWYNTVGEFVHKLVDSDDTYMVQFPLLSASPDTTYDNVAINFYLPEDAEFIGISSAIDYTNIDFDNEKSYFDVSKGHVKVTVNYENLVDSLSQVNVYLKYRYTKANYWFKVLKISGFVFVGLMSYHFLTLLDISIGDDEKKDE